MRQICLLRLLALLWIISKDKKRVPQLLLQHSERGYTYYSTVRGKKQVRKLINGICVIMLIVMMILTYMTIRVGRLAQEALDSSYDYSNIKGSYTPISLLYVPKTQQKVIEVIFTNFTDETLGSGIKRDQLSVNSNGLMEYNGKVVVATATYECLKSSHGACKKIVDLPHGYIAFNYHDEFLIEYKGIEYPAIVLDSCGSCSIDKNEDHQRVDVLVKNDYKFTKNRGSD